MKKVSIYLLMVTVLFITGCGSNEIRVVATLDEFDSVAEENGFTVSDNITTYKNVDYISEASLATYEDIEIEMIIYSDSEYASLVQEQHIESFNLLKSTGAMVEKEKGGNYYEYALISNNRYMVSTRIDNTLIFAKVMLEDKDLVKGMIDSLGY